MAGKILAWSFSRWNTYESCPLKAKFLYVDKLKEPDNPAQARGSAIHKQAENFLLGSIKTLPAELAFFKEEFQKLKKLKAQPELSWAFTSAWQPTGWFDKNAWCRVKLDALVFKPTHGVLVDYKTGRPYDEHSDQLGLYALGGFLHPDCKGVQELEAQDWYLDKEKLPKGHEKITGEDFTADQVEELKDTWADKTRAMLNDTKFLPKPSDKCRFCHFRKANSGPCKF